MCLHARWSNTEYMGKESSTIPQTWKNNPIEAIYFKTQFST